ncbi:SemiSWEET family transporter [Candidatus Cardinium hertigii]|uniref:Sugar transporter SemiSWEET n=1 Tax=Candidatus Cardinium hertigii TaxID=247481 RepID=A0A2Z3LCG2_9BACT|nr:SemiSWEET family transporter [Candidatus Cardinium hertigii]AWN81862.1 hypothetical protein DK880_00543 [Candidatus Cardinium hertigii]
MEKNKFNFFYKNYMMVMGPLANLMFYLQAYKIFTTKQATGVAFFAFVWSFIGLSSWLVYGIVLKSKVLIWSNIAGVIGTLLVLVGILLYG